MVIILNLRTFITFKLRYTVTFKTETMKDTTLECEYCLIPLTVPEATTCIDCGSVLCEDCSCEDCEKSLYNHDN